MVVSHRQLKEKANSIKQFIDTVLGNMKEHPHSMSLSELQGVYKQFQTFKIGFVQDIQKYKLAAATKEGQEILKTSEDLMSKIDDILAIIKKEIKDHEDLKPTQMTKDEIKSSLAEIDCTTKESLLELYKTFQAVLNYLKANAKTQYGVELAEASARLFEEVGKDFDVQSVFNEKQMLLNPDEKENCEAGLKSAQTLMSPEYLKQLNTYEIPKSNVHTMDSVETKESILKKLDIVDCKTFGSFIEVAKIGAQLTDIAMNYLKNSDNQVESAAGKLVGFAIPQGFDQVANSAFNHISEKEKSMPVTYEQQEQCLHLIAGLKTAYTSTDHSEL